ncbi:MAG TPA: hypothetical protein VFY42_03830 [Gemmatimonadales bacterium]|nr:hypothetical protein [Gemmatimonadales bacterium]
MWPTVLSPRALGVVALLTGVGLALSAGVAGNERTLRGRVERIGAGTIQSFVTLDRSGAPIAIGVAMSAGALELLPPVPNTVSRCFDLDGNGRHTQHECIGDEERILDVPAGSSDGLPFRWIQVNWNPAGHHAPYARPHFDFHFHTGARGLLEAIAPGRCGELADCGDFKRATQPVPAQYLPNGYIDVGAVVSRMGNHLLDSQSPELKDSLPFTSTFIYGSYDGELIFWEPMITLDLLQRTQDTCMEIRQPNAFRQAGYYPTQYCVRQDRRGQRTVSLERFRYSNAI